MSPLQQLSDAWKMYWICQWYSNSNGRGSTMLNQLGNRILIKHVATKYPMPMCGSKQERHSALPFVEIRKTMFLLRNLIYAST